MRGAKPKLKSPTGDNVTKLKTGSAAEQRVLDREIAKQVADLMPPDFAADVDLLAEWNRIATMLAQPSVRRLSLKFVDTIEEYVRVRVRIRKLREAVGPKVAGEIYNPGGGRNGVQFRTNPHVAQLNEALRQWRALAAILGLSPTDEARMLPGGGGGDDGTDKFFQ